MDQEVLADEVRKRFLRVSQAMRRDAQALPLTTAQGAVLNFLRAGPMTVGDLAQAEGVRPPSMSQIINRMQEAGWLERPDGAGKGRLVAITDSGRRIAENVRTARNAALLTRLSTLSADERSALEGAFPALDKMFGAPLQV